MTRLGAKKKRARDTWILLPGAPAEPSEPVVHDVWTEEQAKQGCAVTLALMLLLESDDMEESWYKQCVELSWAAPPGSFRYVFWWSLRMLRSNDESFQDVVDYFLWKTSEFDSGRITREATW